MSSKSGGKRMTGDDLVRELLLKPGRHPNLADSEAGRTFGWQKEGALEALEANRERMSELQYKLYADGRFAVLVVLQAIDGGGKDGTIRSVFTAFNPQGCTVTSFKAPSAEELKHDYLWRVHRHVPPRGEVAVFNRSHYEDVLVVRVDNLVPKDTWRARYDQINDFERLLTANNVTVLKFFLQISKQEQRQRFQERIDDPPKQWKFSPQDLEKRKQWKAYRKAFEDALTRCNTREAPWYVVPADRNWLRDLAVSQAMVTALEKLPLHFPKARFDPSKIRLR
jgi:PPK2 family polyphosphate:nucleotide phosphotransferase